MATFSASSRLKTAEEFSRALRYGRRVDGGCVVAHVLRQPAGRPRLGLAITKRVAPRAVDRNRVKRVVREVFRHAAPQLGAVDVVIKLKRLPLRAQWPQARLDLENLFARLAATGEKS